jgi:5'-nucleotidase
MAKKVIIAKDKSMVLGDILIDDHPTPCNETQATRKHLLFDQPYNQNVEHKPRMHRRNDENLLQLIEKMVLSNK